jgi:hypothetical protein
MLVPLWPVCICLLTFTDELIERLIYSCCSEGGLIYLWCSMFSLRENQWTRRYDMLEHMVTYEIKGNIPVI